VIELLTEQVVQEEPLHAINPEEHRPIKNVLVVDDDDNWCFLTKLILQKANIFRKITIARNGQEALNKIKTLATQGERLPELILLDIKMPVMDGFEFLEEIQKCPALNLSRTRIYLSTSSFLKTDKARAQLYPVSGFITKPLTEEILNDILADKK
jgi:CheY-like chemotaxis protein